MKDIVERMRELEPSMTVGDDCKDAADEIERLRAKIEAMEKQEPVFWWRPCSDGAYEGPIHNSSIERVRKQSGAWSPLYLAPGAQPAPIEQDTSVRKAWARFRNELHRSPDAPYPGMSEAFEQHFSQSFTDREWRAESSTWAAAWKAAKRHGAQPAPIIPEGWKLVPIEPTPEMRDAWDSAPICEDDDAEFRRAYREMITSAPEAKP